MWRVCVIRGNPHRKVIYFTPGKLGPQHHARFLRGAEVYPRFLVVNLRWDDPREWPADAGALAPRLVFVGQHQARQNQISKIRAVLRVLQAHQPEAMILAGYNDCTQIAAALWARFRKTARIMQSDSWVSDHPRHRLKEFIKRRLFVQPHFDAAFVTGARASDYARSLGIPADAIWRHAYVADNDYFAAKSQEAREQAGDWRSRLELPQDYFLTVSRLSPEKNLLRLLQAFGRYRDRGGNWSLVLVGSGPQADRLRQVARGAGWGPAVHFAGWRQYEQLPAYYALARCLVLPSVSEPWGLVVNEAMASGLPVLVSRQCGCLPELCRPNLNGFDFDPYDVETLAQLLLRVSRGGPALAAMGQASRRIIAGHTLDHWARSLRDCVETTAARLGR